jgi:hypothetical protein
MHQHVPFREAEQTLLLLFWKRRTDQAMLLHVFFNDLSPILGHMTSLIMDDTPRDKNDDINYLQTLISHDESFGSY